MKRIPKCETRIALGERAPNLVAASLVLLAAAVELGLREAFYYVSSEVPGLLLITTLLLIIAIMAWRGGRAAHLRDGRIVVVISLTVWGWLCDIRWPGGSWFVIGLLVLCTAAACRLSALRWSQARRSSTAAALIFVLSQPVVAAWRSEDLSWPDNAVRPVAITGLDQPEITVFLLLDELSTDVAGPIAAALARSGQPVHRRAVLTVGDGTAKVIPSLLSQRVFDEAKPCGWRTICSGTEVLNLGRLRASRTDVDVVGFYFPYCAIQGLRFCKVLSPPQPHLDVERWRCAAQRRSEWLAERIGAEGRERCAALNGAVWAELGARVEAAIWRAPVWERGGLLFVHAPLPHPPGEGGAGTLEEHYQQNVEKAARLVGAITDRLVAQARTYQFVVFSDHPLRTTFWCRSTQYREGCPQAGDLHDARVPLLATGMVSPRFAAVRNNMEVFSVVRGSGGVDPMR